MLSIKNLSFSFPQKDLFQNISFTLDHDQHCAFIGTNGSGKSTLLQIILDPENYLFDGKIEMDPEYTMAYISQFYQKEEIEELTVFEYISEIFTNLQQNLNQVCLEMETASELDSLLEKYQELLDYSQSIDGDNYESNISKLLHLANLEEHEHLPISKLSGGEFKLVQVMKEMLTKPHLLIMDEPDVFLDFEHLNSLKNLINSHKGSTLVITHNRYLLNHCFNKIIHLENKELQEFDGRYMDYNLHLLQTKIELQELAIADNEEIERNEALVHNLRTLATNSASAARGRTLHARMKMLERLKARRVKEPFVDIKQPDISLSTEAECEDEFILKVDDFSIGFSSQLLNNVSFQIGPKDKVALIGANGCGKTTLMKNILKNTHEAVLLNNYADLGFLSQTHSDVLTESNTVLEEFLQSSFDSVQKVNTHLSNYGFDRSFLEQKISNLSGGEKSLLQLAKISAENANFLLFDEPTSHLDTYSQIALEKAIKNYNGAVLMISHDFYSIVNCVDYVLFIEDTNIRRMSLRSFRKMIYARHFDKDYLEIEKRKTEIEHKVELALQDTNFELASTLSKDLEKIMKKVSV